MWSTMLILFIIVFQIFSVYSKTFTDTQSYLNAIESEVYLNNTLVSTSARVLLDAGDMVKTSSTWRAIIEWWDGSVTRIWESSELLIEQVDVNSNRTQINIRFELFSWKTWSNVISFLWNDSSFTQKIEWIDAGVRWTIFDVDLDAWYIRVSEHLVELRNEDWKVLMLTPEAPFDIFRGSFIDIDVFLRTFQDLAWTEYNKIADNEFREYLLVNIQNHITRFNPFLKLIEWFFPHYRIVYELDNSEDFATTEELILKLNQKSREKSLELVQTRYQDLNFVLPSDELLYARKLRYQQALLMLNDDIEFQQSLLERTLYDLQSAVRIWDTKNIENVSHLLESYSDTVSHIEEAFISTVLWGIWNELSHEFSKTRTSLENIFQIDFSDISLSSPNNILDNTSQSIENFLEDTFWDTIRNFLR